MVRIRKRFIPFENESIIRPCGLMYLMIQKRDRVKTSPDNGCFYLQFRSLCYSAVNLGDKGLSHVMLQGGLAVLRISIYILTWRASLRLGSCSRPQLVYDPDGIVHNPSIIQYLAIFSSVMVITVI